LLQRTNIVFQEWFMANKMRKKMMIFGGLGVLVIAGIIMLGVLDLRAKSEIINKQADPAIFN
jgi:hypothetical protein